MKNACGEVKKRDVNIEAFRCLCMFGVCLLHALDQGNYAGPHRGLDNLMTTSVVGFLFISGWFGMRLTLKHVAKILGIGLYCACVVTAIYDFGVLGHREIPYLFSHVWGYFRYAWFLWCYLALMLMAPVFEPLFDKSLDLEGRKKTPAVGSADLSSGLWLVLCSHKDDV